MTPWSQGWCEPLTVSAHTDTAVAAVEVLAAVPPLFGLDAWWGWQEHTLALILSRKPDGTPMYSTVVVIICRQNGKTTLLYVVVWIYLAMGYTILFTLHERQKAREKFEEISTALKAAVPDRYRVSRRSGAERTLDLITGGRLILATPDDAGGRSETADVVIVDEAAFIKPTFLRAARATTLTKPGAQVLLISSGGLETSHDLARSRAAAYTQIGLPEDQRTTGIIEYAAKPEPGLGALDVTDEELWERCIPTLDLPGGARREALRDALTNMSATDFAREYLSVWSANPLDIPIDSTIWADAAYDTPVDRDDLINVILAVDTSPDQTQTSIVIAGQHRATNKIWAALAVNGEGTAWLDTDLTALAKKWRPLEIVVDALSPAAATVDELTRRGYPSRTTSATTMSQACGLLVTALASASIMIQPDDTLTDAATTATRRPIGDTGWAFKRRHGTTTDITSVVALALSHHACRQHSYHGGHGETGAEILQPQTDHS